MIPRLDTTISQSLTFDPLEPARYPCFSLAIEAGRKGATLPRCPQRCRRRWAVQAFLDGKISYGGIHRLVEQILAEHDPLPGEGRGRSPGSRCLGLGAGCGGWPGDNEVPSPSVGGLRWGGEIHASKNR